jgi:hypothetical protein
MSNVPVKAMAHFHVMLVWDVSVVIDGIRHVNIVVHWVLPGNVKLMLHQHQQLQLDGINVQVKVGVLHEDVQLVLFVMLEVFIILK